MDCLTTPAILSTDVGTFIDDSFAIALLLAQKPKSLNSARAFNSRQKLSGVSDEHTFSARQLDLQLLVTAGGSPLARARVAARFLTRSGHANIPIGLGAPSTNRSGALFNWAEEFDLSSYAGGVTSDGVGAMASVLSRARCPVALIEIGPHTNAHALAARFPQLVHKAAVFAMGGSVVKGIRLPWGPVTPVATTNEREDVASANAMLRANWLQPTQWAPVATSHEVKIDGHRWRAVVEGGALAQLLRECYVAWWNASRLDSTSITHSEALALDPLTESAVLWDVEAVHLAASSSFLQFRRLRVQFDSLGYTQVVAPKVRSGAEADFALSWTTSAGESAAAATQAESEQVGIVTTAAMRTRAAAASERNEWNFDGGGTATAIKALSPSLMSPTPVLQSSRSPTQSSSSSTLSISASNPPPPHTSHHLWSRTSGAAFATTDQGQRPQGLHDFLDSLVAALVGG